MDDQDDPIVAEIPVHLADDLRKNIYMVQFPLRPSYRPMPNAPRAARIKPANNILQLDYDVDRRSEHFDKDAEDYLKQQHVRLHSSSVPALSNYTVGVFRQGQLHLTPITSVLQMRPSLAHIDDAVDDEEDDMDDSAAQELQTAAAATAALEVKEVQFQFKKKQSERAINAIQSSYAFKKQQINAEQWRELRVQDKNSAAADEEFEHLFSERDEELVTATTPSEYLKALRYRSLADAASTSSSGSSIPIGDNNNNNNNSSMDTEEKDDKATSAQAPVVDAQYADVLQILSTDHIVHFDTLVRLLPTRDEAHVLAAVAAVAVAVRGRLFVKSALACRSNSSNDPLAAARDAILRELSAASPAGVSRTALVTQYELCPDATKKTLEHFATLDSKTRTWVFKLPPDESFATRFPTLAIKLAL